MYTDVQGCINIRTKSWPLDFACVDLLAFLNVLGVAILISCTLRGNIASIHSCHATVYTFSYRQKVNAWPGYPPCCFHHILLIALLHMYNNY